MKTKTIIFLLLVFIGLNSAYCQTNNKLSNEQSAWLLKANRHEKNGWTYLHIEGAPEARGFQLDT